MSLINKKKSGRLSDQLKSAKLSKTTCLDDINSLNFDLFNKEDNMENYLKNIDDIVNNKISLGMKKSMQMII